MGKDSTDYNVTGSLFGQWKAIGLHQPYLGWGGTRESKQTPSNRAASSLIS